MIDRIRIDGIYDQRTLKGLTEIQVNDFCFDFRPKSFNFLQEHKFLELMTKNFSPRANYWLHFCNEKEFVIDKILGDLIHDLNRSSDHSAEGEKRNIFLEFSGNEDPSFYNQFQCPYFVHFNPEKNMKKVYKDPFFAGLVFDYNYLHEIFELGNFQGFLKVFYQKILPIIEERDLDLVLKVDWDSNIFPSLLDSIDFSILAFPVNNKIEIAYRNVDLSKARRELKVFLSNARI